MARFPEYGSQYAFSKLEEQILTYWKSSRSFEQSIEQRDPQKTFYFYDGPPFATGLPHYGHIIGGMLKDIIPRYWTMRGYRVERRFGWDTHGLPVEFEMEKTLGLQGSLDIQKHGIDRFNESCRSIVLRYTQDWRRVVERMGRWVDMDRDYKTMDASFMESVWWVFKELWKKGLIYEGKKVVPYSWRLTAPLSNFEASLNYKDIQDPSVTVLMPLVSDPTTALAVWTTTPWTLPSNLAVAIHSDSKQVSYSRFELAQPVGSVRFVIVADALAERLGLADGKPISASSLLGQHYVPLFSCFVDDDRKQDRAFRVVDGSSFVTATDGTGLVHMAPAFGEDDHYTCLREKIRSVDPIDMYGSFTTDVARDPALLDIVGKNFKDADKLIIAALKKSQRLLKQDTLQHSYPYCYRSEAPLMYKAISSWFVNVEAIKSQMLANNLKIHWVPGHIQQGRFGKWLENARDWCISRNRFWGTPIPVWKCEACGHVEVVGSRQELKTLLKKDFDDLHSHFVDAVPGDCLKCQAKGSLKRTPEVLDCWFESGSMPYAQEHYPFENKEKLDRSFPADFIAEGLDQTRGWFYTLTVLSTALFNKPAFKNCVVNGLVLAEDGKKMSKRLKNYPDPMEVFQKSGADALRLYLMQSPAMHGDELRFTEKNMIELQRAVMIPLWNAFGFLASYANVDGFTPERIQQSLSFQSDHFMDRWILARMTETERDVHRSMEAYEIAQVAPSLVLLIDDLTNWYIRMNRERFWNASDVSGAQSLAPHATLWQVLDRTARLMAPFLPFLSESLFAGLRGHSVESLGQGVGQNSESWKSVHLQSFEIPGAASGSDQKLLGELRLAKDVIVLGRSLRAEAKQGVRQPLQRLRVAGLGVDDRKHLSSMSALILRELNIKELQVVEKAADLVEESIKPNHKVCGRKLGSKIKNFEAWLRTWTSDDIARFEAKGALQFEGVELARDDLTIVRKAREGRFAAADKGRVVELDTTLTPELIEEGLRRELTNRIQQRRKEQKFNLSDRIEIRWWAPERSLVSKICQEEMASPGYISKETLAMRWSQLRDAPGEIESFEDLGSFAFSLEVSRKS